jgi:hypothetical protein
MAEVKMTILTALAVFTLGIIIGAFATYRLLTMMIMAAMKDGHLKLIGLHKCPDGHIHAMIRAGTSADFPVLLEDATGSWGRPPLALDDQPHNDPNGSDKSSHPNKS